MLLTVVITVVAVFGYLLNYVVDKDKHKKAFRVIVIIAIVFAFAAIWGDYFHQKAESEKESNATEERHKEMREQNDSLNAQIARVLDRNDSLRAQVGEMSEKLEPFMRIARVNYPAMRDEEALSKLARHISETLDRMQPKIIYVPDKTKSWIADSTDLIHTVNYFRSQYSVAVRDISIRMEFDRPILGAKGKITGAFVVEQGSRTTIDKDNKGITFVTGYLSVGNDIMIEVVSREPLKVITRRSSP